MNGVGMMMGYEGMIGRDEKIGWEGRREGW